MTYAAVIFDLDGTLLDTESLARQAGERAFAALDLSIPTGFFESLTGVDFQTGMALIQKRWPHLDIDALDRHWAKEARAMQHHPIAQKPGVSALLSHLDRHKIPKAIATSSFAWSARSKLQRAKLEDRFETLICVDNVTAPKPDPEPYLLAAQRLGVAAQDCLAFEDSETGSQSAYAAGMTVVLIPDTAPVSGDFAHHLASDLMEGARKAGLL